MFTLHRPEIGSRLPISAKDNKKAFQYDAYRLLADRIPLYPRSYVRPPDIPTHWTYTPPERTWYQSYPPPGKDLVPENPASLEITWYQRHPTPHGQSD